MLSFTGNTRSVKARLALSSNAKKGACIPLQRRIPNMCIYGFSNFPDFRGLHSPSMFAVKAKIMECSIINPSLSLLMKHLVICQRQKANNFSAFIGHHTVVWFPLVRFRYHEGSTFTEKDRNKLNYRIGRKRP